MRNYRGVVGKGGKLKPKRELRQIRWTHPEETGVTFNEPEQFSTVVERLRVPRKISALVEVTPLAMFKMHAFVSGIGYEVGWLGTAVREKRQTIVNDVYLFNQGVSGGHTEITTDSLFNFASELLRKPKGEEAFNNIRFWGHSHVNGSVYPSTQDDEQMDVFRDRGSEFFLRGIFNRRGEVNLSLFDWRRGYAIHDVPWRLRGPALPSLDELRALWFELRAEMREKVKAYSFITVAPQPQKYWTPFSWMSPNQQTDD